MSVDTNVDVEILVIAFVVVVAAAVVQGLIGFGGGLVAAPVLVLLDVDLVPGPILVTNLVMTAVALRREHSHVDWSALTWGSLGRTPGIALGALLLASFATNTLSAAVGLMVLAAVAISVVGWRPPVSRATLAAAGLVSGTFGTMTSVGGPPFALMLQDHRPAATRATLAAFFMIGLVFMIPAVAIAGRFGAAEIVSGAVLAPAAAIGMLISSPLRRFVDGGSLRTYVLVASAVSAIVVLVRTFV